MEAGENLNIKLILEELSRKRPIFHSEADFQHALAWGIHLKYPNSKIRLEVNPYTDGQRAHIDILVNIWGIQYAMELKYKTLKLDINFDEEDFHLLNQSAQDTGRYDYCKDIKRLERFTENKKNSKGIAIFLTNDVSYWKQIIEKETADRAFRIHEERIIKGILTWGEKASKGTMKGRESELNLNGTYSLKWGDYSHVRQVNKGIFRYLLLEIGK